MIPFILYKYTSMNANFKKSGGQSSEKNNNKHHNALAPFTGPSVCVSHSVVSNLGDPWTIA